MVPYITQQTLIVCVPLLDVVSSDIGMVTAEYYYEC